MSDEKKLTIELNTPLAIIIAGFLIAAAIFLKEGNILGLNKNTNNTDGTDNITMAPTAETFASSLQVGDSSTIGKADAPVVVYEFSDFQCPYCGAVSGIDNPNNPVTVSFKQQGGWEAAVPKLKEYAEQGKVLFVIKNYAFLGNESVWAAEAAECAKEQDKFWPFHDMLFAKQNGENQGAFSKDNLKAFAKELKLNTSQFDQCLDSDKYKSVVDQETQGGNTAAKEVGEQGLGTPSWFVNGKLISGAVPWSTIKAEIDSQLN